MVQSPPPPPPPPMPTHSKEAFHQVLDFLPQQTRLAPVQQAISTVKLP